MYHPVSGISATVLVESRKGSWNVAVQSLGLQKSPGEFSDFREFSVSDDKIREVKRRQG